MVRAITFDAFGTLIDTGRDVLIRIARSVCDDQRPSLDAEALLATWDRHFFAAETAPFLTLAEITEDSLGKTFREYGIDATPTPYVENLVALWREAKAYAEVPQVLDTLDGVPRAVVSNADHEFLLDILNEMACASTPSSRRNPLRRTSRVPGSSRRPLSRSASGRRT